MLVLAFPASAGASASTERTAINRAYATIIMEYRGAEIAVKVAKGIVEGVKLKTDGVCSSLIGSQATCATDRAILAREEAPLGKAESAEGKANQVLSLAWGDKEAIASDATLSTAALVEWAQRLSALAAREKAYCGTVLADAARIAA
jgi:hypothetical protein